MAHYDSEDSLSENEWLLESDTRLPSDIPFKNLLKQYQLTEQDCNKMISDNHLEFISDNFCDGTTWKSLPTYLGIPRSVACDINAMALDEREKRRTFYYKWRQMKGSKATYSRLVKSFLKIHRRLDAEEVLKQLRGSTLISRECQATTGQPH